MIIGIKRAHLIKHQQAGLSKIDVISCMPGANLVFVQGMYDFHVSERGN